MPLKIREIYFLILVSMGVLGPIFTAHFPPLANDIFSKLSLLCLLALTAVLVLRVPVKKAVFVAGTPAFIFLGYLLFQPFITVVTAGNKVGNAISNTIYVALFLSCFLIPALLPSALNKKAMAQILKGLLFIAAISAVIDFLGYGKFFGGTYGEILPERLGISQLHGFMPWPNAFANYLLVFSLLLYIIKPGSKSAWFGFALIFPTLVRAHAAAVVLILLSVIKSRLLKVVVAGLVAIVASLSLADFIADSAKELDIEEGANTVYRLKYIVNSSDALMDYPIFGVGLNRLTNRSTWEKDAFALHNRYDLPTELFGREMGTSDTGLTFFFEIGFVGIVLYLVQIIHFVVLSFKLDCSRYALFVIPQLLLLYSFPSIVLSVTFGAFYLFLYGNLIAQYWEKLKNVGPMQQA